MKKLLLSSIIMFGICGFVTAQNATDSKLGKNSTTTTTAAAPTPQKSTVDATPALTTNSDAAPASDKVNAPAAPVAGGKQARVSKTDAASAVSADGTVIATDDLKKKEEAKPVAPKVATKKN